MGCFPCFQSHRSKKDRDVSPHGTWDQPDGKKQKTTEGDHNTKNDENVDQGNIKSRNFTFRELASATKNFRQECLLGEGGFGRVYRGSLSGSGQVVAVKQLDRNGVQGNKEFLGEVQMLSLLHHDNLVNLIGYCADGDQRLLVYEYMAGGSLEDRLLGVGEEQDRKPLDWITRMRIAYGAAQGLQYLHDKADPPVVYRDMKSANILLDESLNPKLSDVGLGNLGPAGGDKFNVSPRVMGTYGYSAPEYTTTGEVTIKSDVYSFGVVLLELITGRRVIDTTKPVDEQNLVAWAQPKFRDPKLFPGMADPLLDRLFPEKALNQAVATAAICLQEEASVRPLMSDVVTTLSFLLAITDDPPAASLPGPSPSLSAHEESRKNDGHHHHGSEREEDDDESERELGDSHEREGRSISFSNSSSSSSLGSFSLGRSSSKGSHSKSISSSSGTSSSSNHGEHKKSLSRSHSKASSGDIRRIKSRSTKGSSSSRKKKGGVSVSWNDAIIRGYEDEEESDQSDENEDGSVDSMGR
ncbi:hypothetical protein SAY87_013582 [Trapa incisa]|uniref:Protein kinase domain-containing protein n=1 Tax=Trapa incisa TaxID=236973 RepID=A0AAN7KFA5_9MYRT|nr:hypothetical protein SAY87_013582 [Trapa incisa]